MKVVDVDFSTTVRGGLVRAAQWRASAPLGQGEHVIAVDADEDMEFEAVVETIEDDVVYLSVLWRDRVPSSANLSIDLANLGLGPVASLLTTGLAPRVVAHQTPVTPMNNTMAASH
ncbi:hypothetical protein [Gordonia sp. SL306]|uniref:hypothetical protein n=1 Tax=Gordonia sp. SL306 TaxID=2995145 RepID=UPI0022700886|nr:hypothetical protein [Gordonia sp. SL306]WAC54257.1 hypothetical protein OVA31_16390 [Gordonia sp. SL306]